MTKQSSGLSNATIGRANLAEFLQVSSLIWKGASPSKGQAGSSGHHPCSVVLQPHAKATRERTIGEGAFLETDAIVGVTRELGATAPPKPIGLTINYLRPGRAVDSYANFSIVKQGRRIVAFEARAWQDDPNKPTATAFGHFMLGGAGPEAVALSVPARD